MVEHCKGKGGEINAGDKMCNENKLTNYRKKTRKWQLQAWTNRVASAFFQIVNIPVSILIKHDLLLLYGQFYL